MTVYFHGTPITPRAELLRLAGRSFCVSFAHPHDADTCLSIGQMVMFDNGAFSAFTRGHRIDEAALYRWIEMRLCHPHKAVILDVINGDVDQQRQALARWPFRLELSWPVWHLDKPIDYLLELADMYGSVCFGSAGSYWNIGSERWVRRMDEAFETLMKRGPLPWVHGLRMSAQAGNWPLASVDSTNIARNHNGSQVAPAKDVVAMAQRIERVHAPRNWHPMPKQEMLT